MSIKVVNSENQFEIFPGKKLSLPEKVKMKSMIKLNELGFDVENVNVLNAKRSVMIFKPELTKGAAEAVFDMVIKDSELDDIDPIEVRRAFDDFLEKKCGILFQAPPK